MDADSQKQPTEHLPFSLNFIAPSKPLIDLKAEETPQSEMPMLSDIMDADTTLYPSSTFVAGLVALSFYIVSLFSVYHRNEEYRQQKEKVNQESAKLYACDEEMDVAPKNDNDKIESTSHQRTTMT